MKNVSVMQTEVDKWQTKYQNSLTRHPALNNIAAEILSELRDVLGRDQVSAAL